MPIEQRHNLLVCPICQSRRLHYAFSHKGYRLVRCIDCQLLLINPQPSEKELVEIYSATYFLGDDTTEGRAEVAEMKAATARAYLAQLGRYRGTSKGRLLEIGCGSGDFLVEAQKMGCEVVGIEISPHAAAEARRRLGSEDAVKCGDIESVSLEDNTFDVCVLSDVIEHTRNPSAFLSHVRRLLVPNGTVFIATPSLDSWSARLLRQNWMEIKPEHLTYFNTSNIQHALFLQGYDQVVVRPGWKVLNLEYVANHFARFPVPRVTPLVQLATRLVPKSLLKRNLRVVASGMAVFARTTSLPLRRKVSVIVPAFNEAKTFAVLMESLLKKELLDLDIEIVVVESNSTDGTRDLALKYQDHPRVKVMLEDRPRGKGHAVRTGLQHARGDFILIQDADLEYDLEDYDVLLEPLRLGREAFVLGSRHGGSAWKMRQFTDQRLLGRTLNIGHWFFTMLVNVLFRQQLKDPFTMFKVFRRDCLWGLTFECNRFDFDYELLIKLIRKGYRPVEIPVNYRSRSFKEGKKVSFLRDPLTWLRALVWLRAISVDPLREIERQRSQAKELAQPVPVASATGDTEAQY